MTNENDTIEAGKGNIFTDLGLPDSGELLLKAQVVHALAGMIRERKLSQTIAARRIGISQPDLSHLLNGHLRGWSLERLMRMITTFDHDVEITLRPKADPDQPGKISFNAA